MIVGLSNLRRTEIADKWTPSKLQSFVKSALRAASQRYPPKYEALARAYEGKQVNSKTGRIGKHYRCNACNGIFPASEVQADHIHPVIDPEVGFVSWDEVVARMFCDADGFQILCLTCHKNKTTAEKQQAKES